MKFRLALLPLFAAGIALTSGVAAPRPPADPLASAFTNPPASAKPQTFWHWMNGHVTRDGITRDLEAMQRVGLGGAMIFDGSTYLPAGPAAYLGPDWRALMTHAFQEGSRLGLKIGMHNGPGWSSSGGPWISPERSMQQLVWTETTVEGGGRVNFALPLPQANLGFYRDARVIAFPALRGEETRYEDEIAVMRTSAGVELDPQVWSDRLADTFQRLAADESVTIEFLRDMEFHGLSAWPTAKGKFPRLQVESSRDGETFEPIATVANPGRHGIVAPAVRSFAPVRARFVRVTPATDGEVADFILHRAPRLADWPAKANFGYRVSAQLRLPEGAAGASIDPRTVIDLTAHTRDGRLDWDAPPGAWTILRVGHTTTGKENVAASAAGRGLECDKMDPTATEYHFNHVIARVVADAAAAGTRGPEAITIDSYEAGMQNWTARFPQEFARRTGYEITGYIPALLGRIVGDAGITERFLYDFRRVQAELMAEYYYGRMGELVRARGMRFYVEGYGSGNFDELKIAGSPDVPMTEFWTRTPWTPNRTVKMVTSAAHVYGKPVVAAEAFTGEMQTSRWLEYPFALKLLGDEMLAQGVNEFVFHRYAHQPHPDAVPGMTMGPWGFHFERTNTWFAQSGAWLMYLARTQELLRHGTYVADVLYFTGLRSPEPSQYAQPVLPVGYTYDLINADALLHRVRVEDGTWVLPDGGRYRLLVLPPDPEAMTLALARKLKEGVEHGAALLGPKPRFLPTLVGYPASEEEMRKIVDALWDSKRETGGRVFENKTIGAALTELRVAPDLAFSGTAPDAALAWQHRRLATGDLYFIANRQRRVEDVVISLRDLAGRQPEIWRPETGERTDAVVFGRDGKRALVPLRLEAGESVFILFRRPAETGAPWLTRDGQPVVSAIMPKPQAKAPANNFTMAIWVKPDTDLRAMPKESTDGRIDEVGKYYAIPADPGDRRFGPGHATAGLAVGRNGIFVVERSDADCPAVLVSAQPVSGWTHVAVVYREGTPRLYIDGKFVREGRRSGKTVHSGVGSPPPPVDYRLHFPALERLYRAAGEEPPPSRGLVYFFEGNSAPATDFPRALDDAELQALVSQGVPLPAMPTVTELGRDASGSESALVWKSGRYELGRARADVEVASPIAVDGPWRVEFPPGRGAPDAIELPELASLHRHEDPGVRYFSGTATYRKKLDIPASSLGDDRRVILDLGRVEVIAAVTVNGRSAGVAWKEPYRLDITELVHAGANDLAVAVSTLWTNRLIGDEQLPAEDEFGLRDERGQDPHGIVRLPDWYRRGEPKPPGGRTTFATWRFYEKDEPLVASGLLGPVRVFNPRRVTFEP